MWLHRPCVVGRIDQVYLYYSPDRNATLPVVLLLHGAGDLAANMIDTWKKFAHKQKIAVIAPELPRDPKLKTPRHRYFGA
jgi:poly(3-hydroxybutyrate) depolymerase